MKSPLWNRFRSYESLAAGTYDGGALVVPPLLNSSVEPRWFFQNLLPCASASPHVASPMHVPMRSRDQLQSSYFSSPAEYLARLRYMQDNCKTSTQRRATGEMGQIRGATYRAGCTRLYRKPTVAGCVCAREGTPPPSGTTPRP